MSIITPSKGVVIMRMKSGERIHKHFNEKCGRDLVTN
jgi:hypothetical protein